MSFSRDVRHYAPTARTLQTSKFGPYAQLSVKRRSEAKSWLYVVGCGVAVGCVWWISLALGAGGV